MPGLSAGRLEAWGDSAEHHAQKGSPVKWSLHGPHFPSLAQHRHLQGLPHGRAEAEVAVQIGEVLNRLIVQRDDEKRLLLGTLSSIESPEVMALLVPHLDNEATRQEAAVAIVNAQMYQKLAGYSEELGRAVAERTQELREANERIAADASRVLP